MTPYTFDGTRDHPAPIADKPLMTDAADGTDALLAENARLRDALTKIYGEAMMVYEPPESAWYRIAGMADRALAREESLARARTLS